MNQNPSSSQPIHNVWSGPSFAIVVATPSYSQGTEGIFGHKVGRSCSPQRGAYEGPLEKKCQVDEQLRKGNAFAVL